MIGILASASFAFSPLSGEPPFTSILTITTTTETTPGNYILTIKGTGGEITHKAKVTLTIKEKPKRRCITATIYGSELAKEIQFLRDFRDKIVLRTFTGGCFMKIFLYPLIGILHLSALVYQILSFNPELGVIAAGVVASSLIGIVYFSPIIIGVLFLIKRTRKIKLEINHLKLFAVLWVISITLTSLSTILLIPSFAMFTTALLVILTSVSSALTTAIKAVKMLS